MGGLVPCIHDPWAFESFFRGFLYPCTPSRGEGIVGVLGRMMREKFGHLGSGPALHQLSGCVTRSKSADSLVLKASLPLQCLSDASSLVSYTILPLGFVLCPHLFSFYSPMAPTAVPLRMTPQSLSVAETISFIQLNLQHYLHGDILHVLQNRHAQNQAHHLP